MSKIIFITSHATASMIPNSAKDNHFDEISLCEVQLSLFKIDEVWKKDPFIYSGVGGEDRKEDKILGVKKNLKEKNQVHAPIVFITCNDPENLQFVDGRHTTACLFEMNEEYGTFVIPVHQKNVIVEAFG